MLERDIFIAALERDDPTERAALLDEACQADAELRKRVQRLLDEHARPESFILDSPPAGFDATVDQPISERPGTVDRPLQAAGTNRRRRLRHRLHGRAAQPVRRKVALKVIKPGMDTRQVIARFEAERQALAMMDHPNIAKVLDAGATESGRPYFVMELVKGVPITEYCDEHQLTPRAAAGAVRAGLPGRAARAPEGHHPPRHQAVERAGDCSTTRRRRAEGDRLRRRQGDWARS